LDGLGKGRVIVVLGIVAAVFGGGDGLDIEQGLKQAGREF
jgi:hypothetical protein